METTRPFLELLAPTTEYNLSTKHICSLPAQKHLQSYMPLKTANQKSKKGVHYQLPSNETGVQKLICLTQAESLNVNTSHKDHDNAKKVTTNPVVSSPEEYLHHDEMVLLPHKCPRCTK